MHIRGLSILLAVTVGALFTGCSTQGDQTSDVGSLRMPLRGSAPSGNVYQLTGALFEISDMGGPVTTLDSDADPTATVLSADLPEGSYQISISPMWGMIDVATGTPVSATLLSPETQSFSIVNDTTTNVAYRFQINGDVVAIGGTLEVTLDIVEASCGSDPQAAALAACTAQFGPNCFDNGAAYIGYANLPGENCTVDINQWAQFCYTDGADGWNCNTCEIGAIKQAHSPCECGDNTATVGNFCSGSSSGVTYSQAFVGGAVSTNPGPQCDAWEAFRGSIDPAVTYNSITLRNTDGSSAVCTGMEAQLLCQSLRTGAEVAPIACGGRVWAIGECGGIELSANGNICSCDAGYSIRPCINNENWGGADTDTCFGPSQTLEVVCE